MLVELDAVVARVCLLVAHGRAVVCIVDIEITRRGRYDDTPQLWAAYTTEIDMAEAREELVVSCVGSTPPTLVLVELIELG